MTNSSGQTDETIIYSDVNLASWVPTTGDWVLVRCPNDTTTIPDLPLCDNTQTETRLTFNPNIKPIQTEPGVWKTWNWSSTRQYPYPVNAIYHYHIQVYFPEHSEILHEKLAMFEVALHFHDASGQYLLPKVGWTRGGRYSAALAIMFNSTLIYKQCGLYLWANPGWELVKSSGSTAPLESETWYNVDLYANPVAGLTRVVIKEGSNTIYDVGGMYPYEEEVYDFSEYLQLSCEAITGDVQYPSSYGWKMYAWVKNPSLSYATTLEPVPEFSFFGMLVISLDFTISLVICSRIKKKATIKLR